MARGLRGAGARHRRQLLAERGVRRGHGLAAAMAALTMALLLAWGARGGTGRLLAAFGAFAAGLGGTT